MSDLISRSAVIDVLKETGIIRDNDLGHLVVGEIERIPTAYNVDKVVGTLEHYRLGNEMSYEFGYPEARDRAKVYAHAIEIVKGGGVNDNIKRE